MNILQRLIRRALSPNIARSREEPVQVLPLTEDFNAIMEGGSRDDYGYMGVARLNLVMPKNTRIIKFAEEFTDPVYFSLEAVSPDFQRVVKPNPLEYDMEVLFPHITGHIIWTSVDNPRSIITKDGRVYIKDAQRDFIENHSFGMDNYVGICVRDSKKCFDMKDWVENQVSNSYSSEDAYGTVQMINSILSPIEPLRVGKIAG